MTDKIFGIHAQALQFRAIRAQILAANLANTDTPGFKARDISFNKILSQSLNNRSELRTTHPTHFSGTTVSKNGPRLQYRTPSQPSIDGNTVDVHRERSEFTQNAMMYQNSLRFVSGRISGLMSAIRGE